MSVKHLLLRYLKENMYVLIFVSLVLVIGIIFGSVMVNKLPEQHNTLLAEELNFYFEVLDETPSVDRLNILKQSFFSNGQFILIAWLAGLTVIGIPVVIVMLFTRGVILGFTVGFIFNHTSFRGLFFAITAIVPHNLVIIPAFLLVSVASISFSSVIFMKVIKNKSINIAPYFVNYGIMSIFILLGIGLASIIEAYIIPVILKWIVPLMV